MTYIHWLNRGDITLAIISIWYFWCSMLRPDNRTIIIYLSHTSYSFSDLPRVLVEGSNRSEPMKHRSHWHVISDLALLLPLLLLDIFSNHRHPNLMTTPLPLYLLLTIIHIIVLSCYLPMNASSSGLSISFVGYSSFWYKIDILVHSTLASSLKLISQMI